MISVPYRLAFICVLVLAHFHVAAVHAFQVETSVDLMTYAKDHDQWKSQYQEMIEHHQLRLPNDDETISNLYYSTSQDRTWRFPKESQVRKVNQKRPEMTTTVLPNDLSFDERFFQSNISPIAYQRLQGHDDTEPFLDTERMWRSCPSIGKEAVVQGGLDGKVKLSQRLSDDDLAFWWKTKDPESYGNLLLE